ncbi:MAG: hypothetical protein JNJ77_05565 [Planctomycetia bacterium]|nr:hypothetical protein [Planctomycetia bacterium]
MSYDINQSQGPYHDGRNQMAGQPALNQPVAPGDVPIAPEESIWRKYSSHYEFPISILLAVLLHVFAVLLVIAYMAIAFYFGEPKPPDMETIVFAGGGGEGDGSVEEFKPEVNEEIKIDLQDIKDVIPPDVIPDKIIPDKNLFEIEANKKRPGDKGKGGPGSGGGKGAGIGTGEGDGAGPGKASGARLSRTKRWRINFKYEDPEGFIEKLGNLKVVVGARLNNGRYYIFEELSPTGGNKFKEMTIEQFQPYATKLQRLWVLNSVRDVCENFGIGANMSERPTTIFIFIPQDMENAILAREEAYHGLKEAEIKKRKIMTQFDVQRTGSGWEVRVIRTWTDPNLKYDDDPPPKKS